jgi:hypothetical protein
VRPNIKKSPSQKRADGVAQSGDPEFKPQYHIHTHTHTQDKDILKVKLNDSFKEKHKNSMYLQYY